MCRQLGRGLSDDIEGWLECRCPADWPDFKNFLDAQGRGNAADAAFGLLELPVLCLALTNAPLLRSQRFADPAIAPLLDVMLRKRAAHRCLPQISIAADLSGAQPD